MTPRSKRPALAALAIALGCGHAAPKLREAPTTRIERFGDGVFSTDAWDFFVAFSPDQRRALFGHADATFSRYQLFETRRDAAGRWTSPTTPRFAVGWSTADPHIAPDGKTVFFISTRPEPTDPDPTAPRATHDIFSAALGPDGEWGDARRLPASVNGVAVDKWSPSVAASGALYFGSKLPGSRGGSDLWVSRFADAAYAPPENLGPAINTGADEVEPWISPDERTLIFSALGRPDSRGGYELYLSRRVDGAWTRAVPLGGGVNTDANEWNHSVSPDGRWLYFTRSSKQRSGDIYRIPMEDIMSTSRSAAIAPGGAYASAYEVTGTARTLYISGQVPERPDGTLPDTFDAQCRQVWANLDRILTEAGMSLRDLVKVTTYLADRRDRADNARIRRELLGDHLPALTILIAGIYDPAWLLEIEAIAAQPLR